MTESLDVVLISYAKNNKLKDETLTSLSTLFDSEDNSDVSIHAIVVESNKDVSYDVPTNGHKLTVIYPTVEFGYHTYLNLGLKQGNAKWTCLCNNDLVFGDKWASKIIEVLNSTGLEHISASPCNPNEKSHGRFINNISMGYGVRSEVAGWCLFQSRATFDVIGELEERIKFWFCDNWYATVMHHYNIPHIMVGTATVHHHAELEGTTTTGIDLDDKKKHELTYGAGDIFRDCIRELFNDDSWGRITDEQKKRGAY